MHRSTLFGAAASLAIAGSLAVAPVAMAAPPVAAGNLVNVQVTDVIDDITVVVEDVNVTVPVAAQIIANVCGIKIPVAVLATQVVATDGTFSCDGTGDQQVTVTND